jgi:hypothetical protein
VQKRKRLVPTRHVLLLLLFLLLQELVLRPHGWIGKRRMTRRRHLCVRDRAREGGRMA